MVEMIVDFLILSLDKKIHTLAFCKEKKFILTKILKQKKFILTEILKQGTFSNMAKLTKIFTKWSKIVDFIDNKY